MRPVVGRKELLTSSVESVEDLSHMIFPNPASQSLNFVSDELTYGFDFQIYRMTGQLCKSGSIHSGQNTLDISMLIPGSYIIRLIREDKTIIGNIRFIKH